MQADKNPYVSDVVYPADYEEGKMPGRINPTSGENLMSLMSDLSAKNRAEDVVNAAPQTGTGTWSGGITRNTDTYRQLSINYYRLWGVI
jgi:hypothetical protein